MKGASAIGISVRKANLEPYVAGFRPAQFLQRIAQRRQAALRERIVARAYEDAYVSRPILRLRSRCEWPDRRAADNRKKIPPLHAQALGLRSPIVPAQIGFREGAENGSLIA